MSVMKKLFAAMVLMTMVLVVNAQRTTVKVSDLPKALIDNVAKDYAGFTIKEATKVVANNVTSYEVLIVKGTTQETLLYDKDGKFVKKVVKQTGTTAKQNPKTPAPEKR
jgi:hypothetical protein